MSPATKLGLPAWLPPFCWSSPLAWFVFTLLVDAGVMMVGWWGLERIWFRQYYLSNLIGDTIGLPLIALGTALVLSHLDHRPEAWYTSKWWHISLFAVLALGWYWFTFHDYTVNQAQRLAPASLWHTTLWPYFAFIMFAGAPAVLAQLWQFKNALAGLAIATGIAVWGVTLSYDMTRNPPPLGGGAEFSWGKFVHGQRPGKIRVDEWLAAQKPFPSWFYDHYNPDGSPR